MVTIAQPLIEEIFCQHGAPQVLLSDRGANFLSEIILEVCKFLNIKKVNTLGYHPQTDGLVERFNGKLLHMIAKSAEKNGSDKDKHLPFLLFAYCATIQESTVWKRSRPRLPTERLGDKATLFYFGIPLPQSHSTRLFMSQIKKLIRVFTNNVTKEYGKLK